MRGLLDRANMKLALPVALAVPLGGLAILTYDTFFAPTETLVITVEAREGRLDEDDYTIRSGDGEDFDADFNIYDFVEDGRRYECEVRGLDWLWLNRDLRECTLREGPPGPLPEPQPPTARECFGAVATSPVAPLLLQSTAQRCLAEPQSFLRCATAGQRGIFSRPGVVQRCLRGARPVGG